MTDEEKQELESMRESEQNYKNRYKNSVQKTDAEKQYWQNLNKTKPIENASSFEDILKNIGSITISSKKERVQLTDFETSMKVFRLIADKLTGPKREYVINQFNKEIIENSVKWLIADPSCEWELDKGIGLIGFYGTGKSYLFKILEILSQSFRNNEIKFGIKDCPTILREAAEDNKSIKKYFTGTFCFDDLGSEETVIKNYGNTVGVLSEIFFEREKRHESVGLITHFTSNLIEEELEEKYGSRIFDRLQKMTTLVVVKQNYSFRKTNKPK